MLPKELEGETFLLMEFASEKKMPMWRCGGDS